GITPPAAEIPPPVDPKAVKADDETDDDEAEASTDDDEEVESGPDPIIAAQRFGAVSDQMELARKALKKHGRGSKQATAELLALAELFMPIKLVPKQ
ncbi:sigma-70 non-essential region-containing protein, partial [Salmonella enterica subsp. enterica]